ncbi:MAG: DUF1311 domain-containing protein [Bacteroidetes bacterium]|nr:MAG: DUF1311 domain-containing protein [Bacteroidota bacterium]
MKIKLFLLLFTFSLNAFGQYDADAVRLSKMEYMKYAQRTDCQNSEFHSSLEHRICLNLEFQKVDSLLNLKFTKLCSTLDEPTVKKQIIEYHENWIEYRRLQSKLVSKGYRGHLLGIVYLDCMVKMTERRIEDVDFLMKNI